MPQPLRLSVKRRGVELVTSSIIIIIIIIIIITNIFNVA